MYVGGNYPLDYHRPGNGAKMTATIIVLSVVCVFAFVIPSIYILYSYVIKPHKTLKEGLKDWVEESADDI